MALCPIFSLGIMPQVRWGLGPIICRFSDFSTPLPNGSGPKLNRNEGQPSDYFLNTPAGLPGEVAMPCPPEGMMGHYRLKQGR